MKRTLTALVAISTLAAAVPAVAQPWQGGHRDGYGGQTERLERRIEILRHRGELNWREARDLRDQVHSLQRLQWRYGRDGLSRWERRDLDRRYEAIEYRIRREARDDYGRPGWGYGPR